MSSKWALTELVRHSITVIEMSGVSNGVPATPQQPRPNFRTPLKTSDTGSQLADVAFTVTPSSVQAPGARVTCACHVPLEHVRLKQNPSPVLLQSFEQPLQIDPVRPASSGTVNGTPTQPGQEITTSANRKRGNGLAQHVVIFEPQLPPHQRHSAAKFHSVPE